MIGLEVVKKYEKVAEKREKEYEKMEKKHKRNYPVKL